MPIVDYIIPGIFLAVFVAFIYDCVKKIRHGNETTDTILSAFTRTVDKLEALAARKIEAVEAHAATILHLQSAKDLASAEAEKAKAAAEKIKALVS